MKTFVLIALLAVAGLLLGAAPARAQYPLAPRLHPTHYHGYPVAPYLRNYSYGFNYVGGPYTEYRNTMYNPFTGYYITYVRGYSHPFGYYSGYARGVGSPGVGAYSVQYIPSYYSPGFFRPSYGSVPSYYAPTY